jgi:dynein light chain LC8-type
MREQQDSGDVTGRRGGVIRSLLGVERRLAEGDADAEGALGASSEKQHLAADSGEERKAVVRVVAADMPPALQRRAFRCARDELAAMPHFPRRLEPKRLALALKKVKTVFFSSELIIRKRPVSTSR